MAKHFLYLTNEKITCLLWRGNAYSGREVFDANNPHSLEFERYIIKHSHVPVFLVVDLTEEDFRLDKIPHLRGADQDAVLTRRLSQVYRNTSFRHALIQGRETEGRRDDRVLYHAITSPDLIDPWLALLEKHDVALEGIYSAPVLSANLLKTLDVFFPHTLLVSLVAGNGLRQTYFHNKQIKFSRLTPIEAESELSFGQQIADESSRTWQYLDSLRFFAAADKLEICLLIHPKDRKETADAFQSYPLLHYRILDTDEVAAKIKLKPAPLTSHAEEIFVHLFATESLVNHYAAPQQTRIARMRKTGLGLYFLTACVLAACLTWAGFTLFQASMIDEQISKRDLQSNELMGRYRAATRQADAPQISADTSRDAAQFYKTFMQPLPAPGNLLREISQVLTKFPEVRLTQIFWQAGNDANANPVFTLTVPKGTPAIKSDFAQDKAQTPATAAATTGKDLPLAGNQVEILVLDAGLATFSGDYRKALADIERFMSALKNIPGLQATLLTAPLDVRPGASIKANLSERSAESLDARFAVRIVRRHSVAIEGSHSSTSSTNK